MLKNYLIVALRSLRKHKAYSLINITGLAIGMACSILIFLWVRDELSFDRFHADAARIVRVYRDKARTVPGSSSALTSPPMAAAFKKDFPEVLRSTRFGTWQRRLVTNGDKSFTETGYMHADPDFFEMFSFPFVKGDPKTAFSIPNSVVLTESAARKYFGADDPMGRTLTVDRAFDIVVTGVVQDPPSNSSLKFSMLSPFTLLLSKYIGEENADRWGFNSFSTFLLLAPDVRAADFNAKLDGYLQRYAADDTDRLAVQPLTDIHLRSAVGHEPFATGSIKYVWIFSALSLFILAIASINFMNLTTARYAKRAREVGMRKVVGAGRPQLVRQFLAESILTSLLALGAALILVELMLPSFNTLSGKALAANGLEKLPVLLSCFGIALATGLLSGIYPALFLSSFRPIRVLKGGVRGAGGGAAFRKTLVVLQFSLSVFLITGTAVISRQMSYMRTKDLGFDKERIIHLRLFGELVGKYPVIRERLLQNPDVVSVTASLALPTDIQNSPGTPEWEGKDPNAKWDIRADFVDFDYIETFRVPIIEGRSFSQDYPTDADEAYIVNEEAVRRMGLKRPVVGQRFAFWGREGRIVGVMQDAHFQNLHRKIEPLVFKIFPDWFRFLYVRLRAGDTPAVLASIEKTWASLHLGYPFDYRFLDEDFDNLYRAEARMGTLFRTFAALAVFIACLGLFGLASFMAEQRTKEIGIRRILGASIPGITTMMSREYAVLVLAANVAAWPAAWFFMGRWLRGFAYRAELSVWSFFASGAIALAVALLTVGILSVKAASANPADALRYE
jgi:putative ABC transport system permease protein